MNAKPPTIVHFGILVFLLSRPVPGATCESLAAVKIAQTSITLAQTVTASTFLPPGPAPNRGILSIYRSLPAFCRVSGVIIPTEDSHIEFEVWLPSAGWNGKYMGVGNPGFAGSIFYASPPALNGPGLANALLAGYAVSGTDTGHKGGTFDARWALDHPEKIVDYGYRAIHETAERSKAMINAFYGEAPKHSYFDSCSNGGREALMEAQRFPSDYDGIIAGAPANSLTHTVAAFIKNMQATEADPASYLSAAKLPALESATLAACDALDGLRDGVIDDPRKCHFDPSTLLCQGPESNLCLTLPQVAALRKIYAPARGSAGEQLYPGYVPGAEASGGWAAWITGSAPGKGSQYVFAMQAAAFMFFQNPQWDFRSYDTGRDTKIVDEKLAQTLNATDADLKPFSTRGGKLIIYHGWSDPAVAPTNSVEYYQSVVNSMGRKAAESFARLYMVPAMQHCGGGPGPNSFAGPMLGALERWVEQGAAPHELIAVKYKVDGDSSTHVERTRPLCPYPEVARYKGKGSIDDAANFRCRVP